MTFVFLAAALGMTARPAAAQKPISVGLRVGAPLTDLIDSKDSRGIFSSTSQLTAGPTASINFPAGVSVQADILYKRFSYGRPAGFIGDLPRKDTSGNSWEFPILLKWTARGRIAPFLDAGASFRNWSGYGRIGNFITGSNSGEIDTGNNVGFVTGGGLALKLGSLRIEPEIRYTRWSVNNFEDGLRNLLKTNRNQAEVLVGFTF
ncbi:MAG: PorT family protein [Bryobacterales bacterium]|nr:PorT family protein [Bryobacterales bacterium]